MILISKIMLKTFPRVIDLAFILLAMISLQACAQEQLKSTTSSKVVDYETARKLFWQELYPGGGETLYCGRPFLPTARKGFNIEHVFPMSWASNGLNCGKRKQCRASSDIFNIIEADLHNLFPSRTDINRARDSFKFAEIDGEKRNFGRECDFEINARNRVAEPRPEARGDIARAMFYMATEYREQGLELFRRQALLLAEWHRADPPSKQEQRRNDRIEQVQGNRNPYIDDPDSLESLLKKWY